MVENEVGKAQSTGSKRGNKICLPVQFNVFWGIYQNHSPLFWVKRPMTADDDDLWAVIGGHRSDSDSLDSYCRLMAHGTHCSSCMQYGTVHRSTCISYCRRSRFHIVNIKGPGYILFRLRCSLNRRNLTFTFPLFRS